MAGQGAPTAIAPSGARRCRCLRRGQTQRSSAPAATDRFAPKRSAKRPGARQRPLPDGEKFYGEVSWRCLENSVMELASHSALILAARITLAHFSVYSTMNL